MLPACRGNRMINQLELRHIELLQHTIGVTPKSREPYRNHFLAGDDHYANTDLKELVAAGYMAAQPAPAMWGDGTVYCCTPEGSALAISRLPKPKKRSRYDDYLHAEVCESFAEWLGIEVPEREYSDSFSRVRLKSSKATGEYCKTLKDAKASYKAALKVNKGKYTPSNGWHYE